MIESWVESRAGRYPVRIGSGLLRGVGASLRSAGFAERVAVVTDDNVLAAWQVPLVQGLEQAGYAPVVLTVSPGETSKTLETADRLWGELISRGFGRSDCLVAFGGGVVGDLAGFVAATFHRGMRLVQAPTTLLAQVDSSIGGKVGIDHRLGKNLIGAFHPPEQVVADVDTLGTLSVRERWNGLAEVVKVALVRDARFVAALEGDLEELGTGAASGERMLDVVLGAARFKVALVSEDEREHGPRALLNFGHTFGHAFEAAGGYGALSHGEAVVLGMRVAVRVSERLGRLSSGDAARALTLLARFPAAPTVRPASRDELLRLVFRDKKALSGAVRFVVLTGIGSAEVQTLSAAQLDDAVDLAREPT